MDETLSGKQIVVTGGCGFIGAHLIKALLRTSCDSIIAIDNESYGAASRLPDSPKLTIINKDLTTFTTEDFEKLLSPSSIVIHLAAEKYNQSKANPERVIETNALALFRLIKAARRQRIQKFIFTSSLYAYGLVSNDGFDETMSCKPHTLYGKTKRVGEDLLQHASQQFGLSATSLRLFFVYGPEQYTNTGYKSVIYKNFKRIFKNEAPTINGDGHQSLDYIYIDDVIDSILKSMRYDKKYNCFNIGTGKNTSINSLTSLMLDLTESSLVPVNASSDATSNTHRFAKTKKAEVELGFTSKTPLKEGLKQTLDWMQHE